MDAMAKMEADLKATQDRSAELAKQVTEVNAKRRAEVNEHCHESVALKGEVN